MTSCFRSPVFQTGRFCLTGLKNRATEFFFLAPLPNLRGGLLAFRDQRRVLATGHAFRKIVASGGEHVWFFKQIERSYGEDFGGDDRSFFADRRADAGDVLPTVAGRIRGETGHSQAAGRDVPTDIADVG